MGHAVQMECDMVPYFSCEKKSLALKIHRETCKDKNILSFLSFLHCSLMILLRGALLFFCLISTEQTSRPLCWKAD